MGAGQKAGPRMLLGFLVYTLPKICYHAVVRETRELRPPGAGRLGLEGTSAIQLKGITKRFGSVVANDHIDLDVKRGQILSLLGENGSGKTTLMNMISGIYFPDEGHIFVEGKEVTIRSPKDAYALGIGMIHQHFKLVDVFTAAENIVLGLEGKGRFDIRSAGRRVKEISAQ